jgi:hypothetical protein
MSTNRHAQFLQIMDRLGAEAKAKGDKSFAEALSHCTLNVSGGNPDCPMARLLMEDYIQTGQLPDGAAASSRPITAAVNSGSNPAPCREAIVDRLHELLKREAIWRKDQRFLESLAACQGAIKEEEFCPLHRLLHSSQPSGK